MYKFSRRMVAAVFVYNMMKLKEKRKEINLSSKNEKKTVKGRDIFANLEKNH